MMSKTQYSNEMHSTEVSMNVMSDRKRLQSNVKNVYTCLLIGFQNLRKKKKEPDKTHLCCSERTACEAYDMAVLFWEVLVCLAFTDYELQAVLWLFVLYSK